MKRIILTAVAVFAFSFANAQDEASTFGFSKGNIIVEGNLGFSSINNKNTETKTSEINFNPKVGYFLNNDVVVGINLDLGNSKTVGKTTETKNTSFAVGAFGRYYFLNLGKRFKTYAEAGLGFGSSKSESMAGNVTVKSLGPDSVNAGLGLGFNYFITEKFAINFGLSDVLSYESTKSDAPGAKSVNTFNANINVFDNFFTTSKFGLTYKF